jgi:hypothetical protein
VISIHSEVIRSPAFVHPSMPEIIEQPRLGLEQGFARFAVAMFQDGRID